MYEVEKTIWRNLISDQATFYSRTLPRERKDTDYPWVLEYGSEANRLRRLKRKLRSLEKRASRLWKKSEGTPVDWLNENYERLFDARSLFEDDLSRLIFDQVIILRLVGFEKYSFALRNLYSAAKIESATPFAAFGFPSTYLGIPLYDYSFTLNKEWGPVVSRNIIANQFFFPLLNQYSQYLIKRPGASFVPTPGMVVYDCGACIGDMSLIFADLVGPNGKVHVFDPVPLHIRFCAHQLKLNPELSDVFVLNELGVGRQTIRVEGLKADVESISPAGLAVDCFSSTSLDDYYRQQGDPVDFIKMDIEGFEIAALEGAQKCLADCSPRLAISAYHEPNHLWQIPLLIKKLQPNYKLFFSHHSPTIGESVIYAAANSRVI